MANLLHSHSRLFNLPCKYHSVSSINGSFLVRATVNSQERKSKKKRQSKQQQSLPKSDDSALASISAAEKTLRFTFMEELMERARNRDSFGVSEVIYDMIAAELSLGPRSFHGLIVSHTLNGDTEGAMQSLRRELSAGLCPLHETFIALVRLFGSKGYATRGLEILAAMAKLNYDIRQAWLLLIEELVRNKHLEDANKILLKGAKGRLRATDELYDLVIEEDCKARDHSNALEILVYRCKITDYLMLRMTFPTSELPITKS